MPTLIGEVSRVTFENETTGFRVIRVTLDEGKEALTVVGVFQPVGPGTKVRIVGDYAVDPKHGRQLRADSLLPVDPDTIQGIERYLSSGLIPGVGPGFAARIVATLGAETLKVLDTDPSQLLRVPGLGARRVEEIRRHWSTHRHLSSVMLLLRPHGGSVALAARIVERYGDRAASIVQTAPYRLALEVRGVGFLTADRIARAFGLGGDHPDRAQAGVLHLLEEAADHGHVYLPRAELEERAARLLGVDVVFIRPALDSLWASERVVIESDRIFLSRLHRAETRVATGLIRLRAEPVSILPDVDRVVAEFERGAAVELSPDQRRAIELAATSKVTVITGGPGVGKTTLVRALLELFRQARLKVLMAAPTGRAAKRMTEATHKEATTIHRLLEFDPGIRRFVRNAERPLDAEVVIIDESSMIDITLAESLTESLPRAARLILVGDADQLPSVAAGAFLRDVIDSGRFATVRLTRIFRQGEASGIVKSAHRILSGEEPKGADASDLEADFFVIPRRDPEQAQATIVELVTRRIPSRFGLHARDQIQVLCPMHRGGAGTAALNLALQASLNPGASGLDRRGVRFCVGDKVLQTKNDYDQGVFNGDLGVIESVDLEQQSLTVRFDDRRVAYSDAACENLTLAYATSIHKSQGSEYPAVVIPLLTSHFVMLSRNLLYTAVTRAKKLCVLVADPKAIRLAVAEVNRERRLTALAERLRAEARALPGGSQAPA